MGKRTTVREDEERKRQERIARDKARMDKHTVVCPHCGEKALDHMTKCPHCGGVLVPEGYRPMDPRKLRIIKGIGLAVSIAAVAVVIVLLVIFGK